MNPLDRSQTPPSPQQEVQVTAQASDSVTEPSRSLQANIANVAVASASQPVTVPSQTESACFIPPASQAVAGVVEVVPEPESKDAHLKLIAHLDIPVFLWELKINDISFHDRNLLHTFIKGIFIALKGQKYAYDPVDFIVEQLFDANAATKKQKKDELVKIVNIYIPNSMKKDKTYLSINWNEEWPREKEVHATQKSYKKTCTIDDTIKMKIYEKIKQSSDKSDKVQRLLHLQAAFAYNVSAETVRQWSFKGKTILAEKAAREASLQSQALSQQAPILPVQPQVQVFNPAEIVSDEMPGTSSGVSRHTVLPLPALHTATLHGASGSPSTSASRGMRTSATLRFAPYPPQSSSAQQQTLSDTSEMHARAATLGVSTEAFQDIRVGEALTSEFNAQMAALPWPVVTTSHFVQEGARRVISPTMRREIGLFIIERCPPDSRVYIFAALRYGVDMQDIVKWASEANE